MRKSVLVFLVLQFCSLAFGQLDSNSIIVSASHSPSLQPDQAIFSLTVQSGIGVGLDDVVAALQGSGITAANLSSLSSVQQDVTIGRMSGVAFALQWVFSLPVSLAKTQATVASLTALQQSITKLGSGLTLSFSIVGTQVSPQLAQAQTCSFSGLVADATAQAQNLAAAGGLTLGAIVAISSSTSNSVSSSGVFAVGTFFAGASSAPAPPPCAITIKFNVTRY